MTDIALQVVQTRTEGMLGASEAAAALGLDKYTSPLTVWKRLRGLPTDEVRSPALDEAASWGQALEPVVRGKYALDRNALVMVPVSSFQYEQWLRATPDGIVVAGIPIGASINPPAPRTYVMEMPRDIAMRDPEWRENAGMLQVKCRSAFLRDEWRHGVPAKEEVQVRVEMAVCDLPWSDVAVLIGGNQMLVHRVERDLALEDRVLTDLRAFWQMVKDGREPSPDHTAAWRQHVSEKMRPTKVTMTADDELREIVDYWLEQRRKRNRAEEEEEAAKTDLLLRLSAAGATAIDLGNDRKVTAYAVGAKPRWKEYAISLGGESTAPEKFRGTGKPSWTLRAPSDDGDE